MFLLDLTCDPIGYAEQRVSNAFRVLMNDAGRNVAVVSRHAGGVLVDRALGSKQT